VGLVRLFAPRRPIKVNCEIHTNLLKLVFIRLFIRRHDVKRSIVMMGFEALLLGAIIQALAP
jgi:hypothetical protein